MLVGRGFIFWSRPTCFRGLRQLSRDFPDLKFLWFCRFPQNGRYKNPKCLTVNHPNFFPQISLFKNKKEVLFFFWITCVFFLLHWPTRRGEKCARILPKRCPSVTAVSPFPPPGLQDRNGRSRLLFLQLELRRLKLACGTMNFNNNNNVSRWRDVGPVAARSSLKKDMNPLKNFYL